MTLSDKESANAYAKSKQIEHVQFVSTSSRGRNFVRQCCKNRQQCPRPLRAKGSEMAWMVEYIPRWWRPGLAVTMLWAGRINEVDLRRARLVL